MITQGDGCAAYAVEPLLPAAAVTTMPASVAPSSASSTVSMVPDGPPTDRFSTSTRSLAARSIAATRSAVAHPSSSGSGADQQAL